MSLPNLAVTADLSARGIDTSDTAGVAVALDVASQAVREAAGHCISQQTSTVTVPAPQGSLLTLPGPVTEVTSVSIDGRPDLVEDMDYFVLPNGLYREIGWDWLDRPAPITVSFTFGYSTVPSDIVDLVCALAAMWLEAKATSFATSPGVTSSRVDDWSETRTVEAATRSQAVWITESTRKWLQSRFGGGAMLVEMGP